MNAAALREAAAVACMALAGATFVAAVVTGAHALGLVVAVLSGAAGLLSK